MLRSAKPATTLFFLFLGITLAFWILRGVGLLTFMPGIILWLFIFLSMGAGIVSILQITSR